MIKFNTYKFIIASIFMLPVILSYNLVFYYGMDTAVDRDNYLYMMIEPSFNMRGEPLIILISKIFWWISDAKVKLILIQNIFIFLIIFTALSFNVNNKANLAVVGFFCSLYILFFAVMTNIQVRIGYAVSIFIFIYFYLKIKPNLNNLIIYLIPLSMHMGVFFIIFFIYIFNMLNVSNAKKSIVMIILSLLLTSGVFLTLKYTLPMIGIDPYYLDYLDPDSGLGEMHRILPNAVIIYILSLIYLYFNFLNKKSFEYWVCYSGLILLFVGYVLDLPIAFKFLIPISVFSSFLLLRNFIEKNYFINKEVAFLILYILNILIAFILFFAFAMQANINLGIIF